jgi:hypothetical protein
MFTKVGIQEFHVKIFVGPFKNGRS